jgi:endoglucanase
MHFKILGIRKIATAAVTIGMVLLQGDIAPMSVRAREATAPIESALDAAWRMYAKRYISPEGRVIDDANGNASHSEGQGYAMLIAVRLNDSEVFARLWGWSRANLFVRNDQLPAWVWDPDTTPHTKDIDDASDGNMLMAWALMEGGRRWGIENYLADARKIARAVADSDTAPSRYGVVLLPGSHGFRGSDRPDGPVVNLSYWLFPAFRELKRAVPDFDWDAIAANGLSIIAAARFGNDKLPTDWISLAGAKAAPATGFPQVFGYDVVRVPLYLAWYRPSDRSALAVFAPLLTPSRMKAPSVIDIETGRARERFGGKGYNSILALLQCALNGSPFPREFYDVEPELYYPTTLHILALLAAYESYPACVRH